MCQEKQSLPYKLSWFECKRRSCI